MVKEFEDQVIKATVKATGKEIFEEGFKAGRLKFGILGIGVAIMSGLIGFAIGKTEKEKEKTK